MGLSTNFKDDVISDGGLRKYNMIQNSDGTVSFEDVTGYSQVGSSYGAKEVNEERSAINELESKFLSHKKNVSSVNNVLIAVGRKDIYPNNDDSAIVFTQEQVNKLLGVMDASGENTVCVFSNGDGVLSDIHIEGATWADSRWYAVFNKVHDGQKTWVNYIVMYFGSQTGSSGAGDSYQDGDEVSY